MANNDKCIANCTTPGEYPARDANCADLQANAECWGPPQCNADCYPTESPANNFIGLRTMADTPDPAEADLLYAEFQTGDLSDGPIDFTRVGFHELYHAAADPWMVQNAYNRTPAKRTAELHRRLHAWLACAGISCP